MPVPPTLHTTILSPTPHSILDCSTVETTLPIVDTLETLQKPSITSKVEGKLYSLFPHLKCVFSSEIRQRLGLTLSFSLFSEECRFTRALVLCKEGKMQTVIDNFKVFNLSRKHESMLAKAILLDGNLTLDSKKNVLIYVRDHHSSDLQSSLALSIGLEFQSGKLDEGVYLEVIRHLNQLNDSAKEDILFSLRNDFDTTLKLMKHFDLDARLFTRWFVRALKEPTKLFYAVKDTANGREALSIAFSSEELDTLIQCVKQALGSNEVPRAFRTLSYLLDQINFSDQEKLKVSIAFLEKWPSMIYSSKREEFLKMCKFITIEQRKSFFQKLSSLSLHTFYKAVLDDCSFWDFEEYCELKFSEDVEKNLECFVMLVKKLSLVTGKCGKERAREYFMEFLSKFPTTQIVALPEFSSLNSDEFFKDCFHDLLVNFPKLVVENSSYFVQRLGKDVFVKERRPEGFDEDLWNMIVSECLVESELLEGKAIPVDGSDKALRLPTCEEDIALSALVDVYKKTFRGFIGNSNYLTGNIEKCLKLLVKKVGNKTVVGLRKESSLYAVIDQNIQTIIFALRRLAKEEKDQDELKRVANIVFSVLCNASQNCVAPIVKDIPDVGYSNLIKYLPISEKEAAELAKRRSDPSLALRDFFQTEVQKYITVLGECLFGKFDLKLYKITLKGDDTYQQHRHSFFMKRLSKKYPVTFADSFEKEDVFFSNYDKFKFEEIEKLLDEQYNIIDLINFFQGRLCDEGLFSPKDGSMYDCSEWLNSYIKEIWPGLRGSTYEDPSEKLADAFYQSDDGSYKPSRFLVLDLLKNAGLVKPLAHITRSRRKKAL